VILQRLLLAIAAGAAIAAAAAISMVALSLAVFGLLRPHIGPAYASAAVAAMFAVLIGLAGLLAASGAGRRRGRMNEREAMGLAGRLMELARDKPIAAVAVALAMGVVLVRSPKSLGAIARAFFESLSGVSRGL
jgi:hypothetical protein